MIPDANDIYHVSNIPFLLSRVPFLSPSLNHTITLNCGRVVISLVACLKNRGTDQGF